MEKQNQAIKSEHDKLKKEAYKKDSIDETQLQTQYCKSKYIRIQTNKFLNPLSTKQGSNKISDKYDLMQTRSSTIDQILSSTSCRENNNP